VCITALLSASFTGARPCEAEESSKEGSDSAKAFADAVKLFKAGQAERALPVFEQLARSTPSPNAKLYVGYCLMDLGRYPAAHRAFSLTIQSALALKDNRYDGAREAAQEQVLALNLRLAKLVLSFVETPPTLVVKVDDAIVDPSELGSALVLEPGSHHIEARAEGLVPLVRDETIEAGGSKTLTLSFAKPAIEEPKPLVALPRRPDGGTLRTLGFVAGGVAVAGLSVFAVTALKAQSIHSDLEDECPRGCSDPNHVDLVGRGKSMQTVANVSLAVGALGALGSASLLYLGYRQGASAEPSIALNSSGVTLRYRGTF
jgi:hypothetical protein